MAELTITKDNFQKEVLESDIPVLVDFWATWCGPCQMLAPTIAEIAEENEGKIKVGKVNVDEQPGLAALFQVTGIPTVILFKNGIPEKKSVGYVPKSTLEALFK